MNYISGIISAIIGIGSIVVGVFGLHQYFGGDEKHLQKLEQLKGEGHKAIAEIDTMVLEVTIKGMKSYQLGYKFKVDEKPYKGTFGYRHDNELEGITGLVTYLPSDPKINSLNIDGELAEARKEVADNKSSKAGLIVGIGLLLFGLFNLLRALAKFRRGHNPAPVSSSPPPMPPRGPQNPPDSDFV